MFGEIVLKIICFAFPLLLCAAAYIDLKTFLIPNEISVGLATAGCFAIAFSGMPPSAMLAHVGVGAGCLLLGFALFAVGLWGGGDGKLIAAAGLWFDPSTAITFLLMVTIANGAFALFGLGAYQYRVAIWSIGVMRSVPIEKWRGQTPYGVGIAIGAIIAFQDTALFRIAFG